MTHTKKNDKKAKKNSESRDEEVDSTHRKITKKSKNKMNK